MTGLRLPIILATLLLSLPHLGCDESPDSVPSDSNSNSGEPSSLTNSPPQPTNASEETPLVGQSFTEMTDAISTFTHISGSTGEFLLPEIFGAGVVMFDADQDGDLDLYFVQSGSWENQDHVNRFYRNEGKLEFVDATEESGLGDAGYGMGACAGDYDNDGDLDVWVSNFGRSVLYQNQGNGKFIDITEQVGLGGDVDERWWAVSACFVDYDLDGRLDLYVGHYLKYTHETNKDCGTSVTGIRDYCSPGEFEGLPDALYHNEGPNDSGITQFREASREAGTWIKPDPKKGLKNESKALGVVAGDFNKDGWPDLYVANDQVRNLYFQSKGDGTFEENGFASANAFSRDGVPEASMGLTFGDPDGDLDDDLFMTHLDLETNTFYTNEEGYFEDDTAARKLSLPSKGMTGFGTEFFDYDNDGDLDLIATNGHVLVNVSRSRGEFLTYPQRDQLFENLGKQPQVPLEFRTVPAEQSGTYFDKMTVGRGLAIGDLDHDGDLDVVISIHGQHIVVEKDGSKQTCGEPGRPVVLRNNDQNGKSLLITLIGDGQKANRQAVGAVLTLTLSDGTKLRRTVRAGSSYASQSDGRLHFGLGSQQPKSLHIQWPDRSHTEEIIEEDLPDQGLMTIEMGLGIRGS